jgi:hypothetical protein
MLRRCCFQLADLVDVNLESEITPEVPGKPVVALLGRAALVKYVVIYDGPKSSTTLRRA